MTRFAEGTSVSADRSRAEIEQTLKRYGADAFSYAYEPGRAVVAFRAHNRYVKLEVPLPNTDDPEVKLTPSGLTRSRAQRETALAAEERRRWRATALIVKAKLEAVASGVMTFDQEFGAFIVLPDGSTVGEWLSPQIEEAYESGDT